MASYSINQNSSRTSLVLCDEDVPSLREAIDFRTKVIYAHPAWRNEIITGDVVLYSPSGLPRIIHGESIRGMDFNINEDNEEELFIGGDFFNRFCRDSHRFVSSPTWVDTKNLQLYPKQLGGDLDSVKRYKRDLFNLGISRIEIYSLPQNYVHSKRGPFIRKIRLRGVYGENTINRGGICADVKPVQEKKLFKQAFRN